MQRTRKVTAAAARKARRAAAKRHGKLRRAEASQYLWEVHGVKYAVGTLTKYAMWGTGPVFRYLDGWIPVYDPKDLDEWVKPSLGEPRRHTRQQPRDPAAAHQPNGNVLIDKPPEHGPIPSLGPPTRQARSYDSRRRHPPMVSDPVRGECA